MAIKSKQNGHAARNPVRNRMGSLITINDNTTLSRASILQLLQGGVLPDLNINAECRYPESIQTQDYQHMYERQGVATRVVSIYPEESWQMEPDIYETEDLADETAFEKAWEAMKEELNILPILQTADEISGIGEFGVMLLGFDDGLDPKEPVPGVRDNGTVDKRTRDVKLLSVRPLSQTYVRITRVEQDVTSPRFGLPTEYQLIFADMTSTIQQDSTSQTVVPVASRTVDVHWSRVLHIADNRKDSIILGVPRMRPVFNRIIDIRKILGANGQGNWQGGFPGLSIETQPNIEAPEFDKEGTKQEVQKYLDSQQRALFLEGLTARSLSVQIADPTPHYETHLADICVTIGCPMRVFKGTEEAKLASSQDMRTWNKRLFRRQNTYISPFILNPFFERMFLVGALPRPKKLYIKWPDLNAPTENDKATNAQKITDSLFKYVTGNLSTVLPPKEYFVRVLGYSQPVADQIIKELGPKINGLDALLKVATTIPKAAPAGGKKPAKKTKKQGASAGAGPAS